MLGQGLDLPSPLPHTIVWTTKMIFDELEIDSVRQDGNIYVNADSLANHIIRAANQISHDASVMSSFVPIPAREKYYVMGILQGMSNVVMLLQQGNNESKIEDLNTIEDLLEKFREHGQ